LLRPPFLCRTVAFGRVVPLCFVMNPSPGYCSSAFTRPRSFLIARLTFFVLSDLLIPLGDFRLPFYSPCIFLLSVPTHRARSRGPSFPLAPPMPLIVRLFLIALPLFFFLPFSSVRNSPVWSGVTAYAKCTTLSFLELRVIVHALQFAGMPFL